MFILQAVSAASLSGLSPLAGSDKQLSWKQSRFMNCSQGERVASCRQLHSPLPRELGRDGKAKGSEETLLEVLANRMATQTHPALISLTPLVK